jgi:thymidine kinase
MLTFIYSTVNAGKSANLLMRAHSCSERGMKFLILAPDITESRDGVGQVASRIGFKHEAVPLSKNCDPLEIVFRKQLKQSTTYDVIFIDESQFLTREQVMQVTRITDNLSIPVFAYGLRTDFMGNPFEGASFLMAWSDKIEEIATFAVGGEKAIFNQKVGVNGERVTEGEVVDVGFHYLPVTRSEFDLQSYWKSDLS